MFKDVFWIVSSEELGEICPEFFTKITLNRPVRTATLAVSAIGVYEAQINGNRVGDFFLAPGCTSYKKRLQYQEYDVTEMLAQDNEIGIAVGKGWHRGRISAASVTMNQMPCAVIAKLKVVYEDGTEAQFVTDESWHVRKTGVLFSDHYDGEIYDATADCSEVYPVVVRPDLPKEQLIPQEGEIIREKECLKPVRDFVTPKGERVLDFGQNMAGNIEFTVTARKGEKVVLSVCEVLDRDGNFYTENYRSAKARLEYICKEGSQTYKMHFTFLGFRYVRLDECPDQVNANDFTAIAVYSDMKRIGYIDSGDARINRLFSNTLWSQRANFIDIPTDCPQRDEKMGWLGDAQVFSKTAGYNYHVKKFFAKWLADMRADQRPDGSVPDVVPNFFEMPRSSTVWGDAATIIPWNMYMLYGDSKVLQDHFGTMKSWVDYMTGDTLDRYLWTCTAEAKAAGKHYGDWLGLDAPEGSYKGSSDDDLIASAFYAHSTQLVVKAGKALGEDVSSYEELYNKIVETFKKRFPEFRTQTECALALHFGLTDRKEEVAKQLVDMIRKNGNRLQTGFVGTPYLLHALSESGYVDVAYDLLLQNQAPSWLYEVEHGATSIWEHWDGIREDGTFWSADMNSYNHYAYGSVMDWIYTVAGGICPVEEAPGFRKLRLAPKPDPRMGRLKVSFESEYGEICSEWKYTAKGILYDITTPVETQIEIGDQIYSVDKGNYQFLIEGNREVRKNNNMIKLLPRGYYAVKARSEETEKMYCYGPTEFQFKGETYLAMWGDNIFATLEEACARASAVPEQVLDGLDYESFTTPVILFSEGIHGIAKGFTFDRSLTLLGQGASINPNIPSEDPLEPHALNPKRSSGETTLRGSYWSGEFIVQDTSVETVILDGFSSDNLRFKDDRCRGGKVSIVIRNIVHTGACGYTLYQFAEPDADSDLDREVLLQNIRVVNFDDWGYAGNFTLASAHKMTLDGICYDTTKQVFGFTDIAHKHFNTCANFSESEFVITNSYFRNLGGENGISTACDTDENKKLYLTVKDSIFVNASKKDEAVLIPHMVGEGSVLKVDNCTFVDERENKGTAILVRGTGKAVEINNCTFLGFAGEWSNDLSACIPGPDYIVTTEEGFVTETSDPHHVLGTGEADYTALDAHYEGTRAYYGDLHVHTDCGGTSDGAYPMKKWPADMDKLKVDFVAIVDHRQMRGYFLPEWDETRFIYGTEPGAVFLDTNACRYGLSEIHYNMLFPDKYSLAKVLANFPEFEFHGDELTGSFSYPQFTKARFQELTAYLQSIGGIMVHPHPKRLMCSDDPMDYYVGEHMYLEIFHYNLSHNETIKNYELWLELLALGKHVYASGGTDTHTDVSNEGVSTFYSREKSGKAFYDVMHSADFATGAVGMKMCICDGENCYPMGSETSYRDGMELHLRLDDFYEPSWEDGTTYELRIYTDKGLAYASTYNGKLSQAVSLKVQDRDFYRAEVYNKTSGHFVSVGNPIWLDGAKYKG